jgi:putative copper resistance protein D
MTSPVAGPAVSPVATSAAAPARLPVPALVLAALVALPLAAVIGEAATAPVVADPGGFVRWGVLYSRVVHDLAASAPIGLLIHAA